MLTRLEVQRLHQVLELVQRAALVLKVGLQQKTVPGDGEYRELVAALPEVQSLTDRLMVMGGEQRQGGR